MEFGIAWWVLFTAALVILLVVDIARPGVVARQAVHKSIFWVLLALAFTLLLYFVKGPAISLDFFTGYLIEKSLSIDNLFVFLLIFTHLQVPKKLQHRILMWGIFGAYHALYLHLCRHRVTSEAALCTLPLWPFFSRHRYQYVEKAGKEIFTRL